MIYWFYLLIAAVFESCWIYSLKFLDMKQVAAVRPGLLLQDSSQLRVLLPLAGYIVFGLCNIYFFSSAMKGIQASTAFAVWMAMALILAKIMDVLIFNEAFSYQQFFFTAVLLVGIIGLKYYSKN